MKYKKKKSVAWKLVAEAASKVSECGKRNKGNGSFESGTKTTKRYCVELVFIDFYAHIYYTVIGTVCYGH